MNFVSLFAQSPYYAQNIRTADPTVSTEVVMTVMLFSLLIAAAAFIITSYLLSCIFKKAGIETWKAWVPVYSNWVMLELGGQKGYWAIFAIIPLLNIITVVFMLIAMYHIGIGFGKDGSFVVLAVFLPLIWYAWLAIDSSTWKTTKKTEPVTAPTIIQNPFRSSNDK